MTVLPNEGSGLDSIVTEKGKWVMKEIFGPNKKEREHNGYTDVHQAFTARTANDGWLAFEFNVIKRPTLNHNDGKAWVVLCNSHFSYCSNCASFLKDFEYMVDGNTITPSGYVNYDRGKLRDWAVMQ